MTRRRALALLLTALLVWGGAIVVAPAVATRDAPAFAREPAPDLSAFADEEIGLVEITEVSDDRVGAGTGIVIDPSGLVLTAYHVVDDGGRLEVAEAGSDETLAARVLGFDRGKDIALLQVDAPTDLATVRIGDSDTVKVDDAVIARGNAPRSGTPLTRREGEVKESKHDIELVDGAWHRGYLRTNVEIKSGDSGGALLDEEGRVVGLNAASRDGTSTSFHVPINEALAIADQIRSGQSTATVHVGPPAALGVAIDVDVWGVERPALGVRVREIAPDGPAARGGIVPGDVIVAFNGRPITSWVELLAALDAEQPGNRVELTWVDREFISHTALFTLETGQDGAS